MTAQQIARTTVRHLNVSEWFGPTIQGEGRNAGQLASFLRLSGCNLSCSWCDSAYTWDWSRYRHAEESTSYTVDDVADALDALPGRIVITGGEPLLQHVGLADLIHLLPGRKFDVETNGTRPLGMTTRLWDTITCSPKITPSAGLGPEAWRLDPGTLSDARTDLKFVIRDQLDLDAVDGLLASSKPVQWAAESGRVWLMPEGTTPDALDSRTPFVIQAATDRGLNFTSRLHVYGWHDVRGH
jgi:7-carboxy-7-deazaguanine synthase